MRSFHLLGGSSSQTTFVKKEGEKMTKITDKELRNLNGGWLIKFISLDGTHGFGRGGKGKLPTNFSIPEGYKVEEIIP